MKEPKGFDVPNVLSRRYALKAGIPALKFF
jgi:hypothetical protein